LVSAGDHHSCILQTDGKAWCWGGNQYGQLGNHNTTDQMAPGAVINLAASINIAAGGEHTCGVGNGGEIACWGRATSGQLGDGLPQQGLRSSVGLVVGVTGVAQASSGRNHTCIASRAGQLACWGAGSQGQLGNDEQDNASRPVNVPAAGVVQHLSAGAFHTTVATQNGQVRCWGRNHRGQCGQGHTTPFLLVPVPVGGIEGAVEVAAGGSHTCARTSAARVYCWGEGSSGQLGLDDNDQRSRATELTRF
jgi:alpha-tubulin suppressor-like RCC1 family protein